MVVSLGNPRKPSKEQLILLSESSENQVKQSKLFLTDYKKECKGLTTSNSIKYQEIDLSGNIKPSSNEVDETGAYYTEWSKSERKTPIEYVNEYIWNLERW